MIKVPRIERLTVGIFFLVYILAASLVSLHRYWQYDAFWYDFGILDETIWRWSKFQLPIIPNLAPPQGKLVWGDHFNPTLILLAPLYWLTNRAEVMLVAQVVVVVASAFIAYQICIQVVKNSWVRLALVVSYLGYVGLQNALYTDIHNVVFALLPFMFALWAMYRKRWRWYWVGIILTLGVQENLALVVVGLGMFQMLTGKYRRIGLSTALIGLVYGLLVTKVVIPYFSGSSYNYQPDLPPVWHEWISRFFSKDLKTPTIIFTLLTFGGMPILSVAAYPLITLHFLERFVLNAAATRWDLGFHYNAFLSPILFLASMDAVEKIQKNIRLRRLLPLWGFITIGIVFVLHRFILHGPLMLATHPVFYEQTHRNVFLKKFADQIPRSGLIMTQNNIAAHLTHEKVVLLNPAVDAIGPQVVAIDMRTGQNANNFFPLSPFQAELLVASLSAHRDYEKNFVSNDQLVFTRKASE